MKERPVRCKGNDTVPGVGTYNPDYFAGRKTYGVKGGRFNPLPRRRRIRRAQKRDRKKSRNANEAEKLEKKLQSHLRRLLAQSAWLGVLSIRLGLRSDLHQSKTCKASSCTSPICTRCSPELPAYGFGKTVASIKFDSKESCDGYHQAYDVDGALRAVERRPAGGKFNPPRQEREVAEESADCTNHVNISRADKITRPRIKGSCVARSAKRRRKGKGKRCQRQASGSDKCEGQSKGDRQNYRFSIRQACSFHRNI